MNLRFRLAAGRAGGDEGTLGMKRNSLRHFALATALVLTGGTLAWGGDTSVLRPPKGSKVAILVFEDLQCPDCARAAPLLHEAAKKYNIPLVQYDFPLPMHNWSFDAAVYARYFDSLWKPTPAATTTSKSTKPATGKSKSTPPATAPVTVPKDLGDQYRLFIFQNQPQINPQNLRGITERFATDHKVTLPFVVDPTGELAAKVKADYTLGQRVGLDHTPTIYVVSDTTRGTPFVEVVDRTQLYQLIDQVIKEFGSAAPAPKATATKTTAAKKPPQTQ
jgi:thiol-disulfide isomerase/thioredoxin